ncbi:MAG: VWA domain-containing protein [Acidobacteriaceae bacterium]
MLTRTRLALFLGIFLLWSPLPFAQSKPPQALESSINLDVVVTPKQGPPVAGLQQQDFKIFDNKSPQPITSFRAISGDTEPVHVLLLIDAVNSTYQNIAYQRDQIDKFLHSNGGRLAQPLALAFFTDNGVQIQQDFSSDGNEVSSSLDQYTLGLRTIHRSSQWQGIDRFQLSINALRTLADREATLPGRKLILWVSPGWPLLSGPGIQLSPKQQNQIFATIVGLSDQLRQARITLYAIDPLGANEGVGRTFYYREFLKGASKPGKVAFGDLGLQVLSVQSGGLALSSSNDVTTLLRECVADTGAYYELSFERPPADHPNEYHALEVQVANPGLTARTRTGYYAQP